jgi:hypothetical protein
MTGQQLDTCGSLTVRIGDEELAPEEETETEISFGTLGLPAEAMELIVLTSRDGAEAALLKEIAILPAAT